MINIKTRYFSQKFPEMFTVYVPVLNSKPKETIKFYQTNNGLKANRCVSKLRELGIDSIEDLRQQSWEVRRGFALAGCDW